VRSPDRSWLASSESLLSLAGRGAGESANKSSSKKRGPSGSCLSWEADRRRKLQCEEVQHNIDSVCKNVWKTWKGTCCWVQWMHALPLVWLFLGTESWGTRSGLRSGLRFSPRKCILPHRQPLAFMPRPSSCTKGYFARLIIRLYSSVPPKYCRDIHTSSLAVSLAAPGRWYKRSGLSYMGIVTRPGRLTAITILHDSADYLIAMAS
jgi:hypothetical protein